MDLKLANHTLGLAKEKVAALSLAIGNLERRRLADEIASDIALAERTIASVMNRGGL